MLVLPTRYLLTNCKLFDNHCISLTLCCLVFVFYKSPSCASLPPSVCLSVSPVFSSLFSQVSLCWTIGRPEPLSLSPDCRCLIHTSIWITLSCLFVCHVLFPGLSHLLSGRHLKLLYVLRDPSSMIYNLHFHNCIYCDFLLLIYSVHTTSTACLSVLGEGSLLGCSS